jgi:CBS domain-containing protein
MAGHPGATMNEPSLPDILSCHRALGRLPPDRRAALAARASLGTHPAGSVVLAPGQWGDRWFLVVRGAVQLADADVGWAVPVEAGEAFGAGVTAPRHQGNCTATALQDAVLASLPGDAIAAACRDAPGLAVFFPTLPPPSAAAQPAGDRGTGPNLLAAPLRALVQRPPVTAAPQESIRAVAERMRAERVSSVLLLEQGRLIGLVTDRDLRNRVLAEGLDPARPVADIATPAPLTAQAASPAFDAMALMARHNIHHVPVMDGARVAGLVTATNLSEQHGTSPVFLAGEIHRQSSLEGLVRASGHIGMLQRHLAAAGASADSAGRIVTSITDAVTTRLIHLAEAALGPAPVDYAWVVAGSQARGEQTARTDQDNCLVLDDSYDEARHGDWFRAFARFVCDGLAACGYVHCPGGMMAMTDTWRQPRRTWARYFRQWIDQPEPMALMLTSVFFDQRAVHGRAELLDGLRAEVLQRTRSHSLFLAHMAGNALKHRPPLGLFGQILPERGGPHAGHVDLKHSGIGPIVDLARLYALAGGIEAVNTQDRLARAGGAGGEVTSQAARDLGGALEFLGKLRLAHQARQLAQGLPADNHLALEELSNLERSHLKEAFAVVQQLQSVLQQRYGSRY